MGLPNDPPWHFWVSCAGCLTEWTYIGEAQARRVVREHQAAGHVILCDPALPPLGIKGASR